MIIRGITKQDFDYIVSVFDAWWGGPSTERASPFFFYELGEHALIAEGDGEVAGFLLGPGGRSLLIETRRGRGFRRQTRGRLL